ncbi:hypothetical protein L2E82_48402 [Cichorium intybus]|uniref:Uncharacterized protein n=1 Tax=Cichorium intybus TaxID=13427 RepID=A0ACB8YZ44_CICIN|nr:hypothetical protein L2E82_48402 [Cichorium intybus]
MLPLKRLHMEMTPDMGRAEPGSESVHLEGNDVLPKTLHLASSSRLTSTSDDIPNPENQVDSRDTRN